MTKTNAKAAPSINLEMPVTQAGQGQRLATRKILLNKFGLNIRYAELGDKTKPALLLFHGVPENLQAWYAVAPRLAQKYHVFAIDWPGFGGSDPLPSASDYISQNFADIIVDFMDTMQIEKANLVGTDIGLLPSFLVGLQHPERVIKISVSDGIPIPQNHSSWELKGFAKKGSIVGNFMIRWFPRISSKVAYLKGFYRGYSIPAEIESEFLSDGLRETNKIAFKSYFENFYIGQEYFAPRAHELKLPVQILWAKQDRFINVKLAYEIHAVLPNSEVEILDKAGHYIHMDKPQEMARSILKFLAK